MLHTFYSCAIYARLHSLGDNNSSERTDEECSPNNSFDQPINESVLAKMVDFGKNGRTDPHTEIDAPCHIASKSVDRDPALTFAVSSDRHEIIIEGSDFSIYDTQSLVVTFYPDPNYRGSAVDVKVRGEATYETRGYELKAPIKLTDPINQKSVLIDDTNINEKHISGLSGLLDIFLKSQESFLLNMLGIIAVLLASIYGWHRPNKKSNQELKAARVNKVVLVASSVVAILMLLITGSTWIEKHISHAPTILCWSFTHRTQRLPNCAFWGVTIVPTEPVKIFHLVIDFDQPIYDNGVTNGLIPSTNFRLSVAPIVGPPCNLPDKSSDRNGFLTFSVSSDNRQIIVSGHNLTSYDSQTFIMAFYPDPNRGKPLQSMQVTGEAAYEAFGHDVPAHIKFLNTDKANVTEADVTDAN